jgi:hypothetical protein
LFWDDTNNRLGVGTNAPDTTATFKGGVAGAVGTRIATLEGSLPELLFKDTSDNSGFAIAKYGQIVYFVNTNASGGYSSYSGLTNRSGQWSFGGGFNPSATVHIKGSGSTSATTSLLVQNSAGSNALTILDNLNATFGGTVTSVGGFFSLAYSNSFQRVAINNGLSTNPLSYLISNGVGQVLLVDNTEADFNRLQFGGTSASFPSLKRASNNLEIRNADDTFGAGLSIGAALNASAILQASSTTKGFLPPVMTTTQKNAIASPATGLVLYDSTTNKLQCYNGSTWNDLF